MNVAHEEIDLKNPKTNRGNAGFSDEERAKMTRLLASGSGGAVEFEKTGKVGPRPALPVFGTETTG